MKEGVRKILTYGVVLLTFSNLVGQDEEGINSYTDFNGFVVYYLECVDQRGSTLHVEGNFRLSGKNAPRRAKHNPVIEVGIDMNDDGILNALDEFMLFRFGKENRELYREIQAGFELTFPIESRHLGKNVKITYWNDLKVCETSPTFYDTTYQKSWYARGRKYAKNISKWEYDMLRISGNQAEQIIEYRPHYNEYISDLRRGSDYFVSANDEIAYIYGIIRDRSFLSHYIWFKLDLGAPEIGNRKKVRMK